MEKVRSDYQFRVMFVITLCLIDIVINGIADYTSSKESDNILPYIFGGTQIGIQVINLLMAFLLFSGTYLFQVGLLGVLLKEFRWHLLFIGLYLVLFLLYLSVKLVSGGVRCTEVAPFHPFSNPA